ncbi:MAG: rhodanese-like domain-containing protein [Planctomycetota bacterium]
MPATKIVRTMTMKEVLAHYPAAQRALFRRYHVGGCSSCGFQPDDTLEKVCTSHNLINVDEVIDHIEQSQKLEEEIQIGPAELKALMQNGGLKLLDVRAPHEASLCTIEGSQLVDQELAQDMMDNWPKETPLVVYCHHGVRSLDAATWLIGHGFKNVKSLKGGIDAWATTVEPGMRRY